MPFPSASAKSRTSARSTAAAPFVVLAACILATAGLIAILACLLIAMDFLTAVPTSRIDAAFTAIFLFYAFAVVFPAVLFMAWSREPGHAHSSQRVPSEAELPYVSIVIPAYNEEAHIAHAVAAARGQDYPRFEVIVVDDGSSDRTACLARRTGAQVRRLCENRGKAEAANAGLAQATGEIVICSDADTVLHPTALRNIVREFHDPLVGAVAGRVDIAQPGAFLHDLQAVEYTYGQQIIKRAQTGSQCPLAVLPGPLMAIRRRVFDEIGGLSRRTLTEDFDATIEVIRAGYDVRYAPDAIARTVGPGTWSALHRQRLRWSRGMFQTLLTHRTLLLNPRYGLFSMFWLPYYLVSGFCTLALDGLLVLLIAALMFWGGVGVITPERIIVSKLVIEALSSLALVAGLVSTGEGSLRLLSHCWLIKPMKLFLACVRTQALYQEWRGKAATW